MPIDIKKLQQAHKSQKPEKQQSETSKLFELLNKDISLFGSPFKASKKQHFYSEMYILLSSGLDIKSGLEIIIAEEKNKKIRQIYTQILDGLKQGLGFTGAIQQTKQFTDYEYHSLKVGEQTGRLSHILNELASFYQKRIKQKQLLVNALSYPVLVLVTSILAVFFMMKYLVPMFADLYTNLKGDLPALTRFIMNLSEDISYWMPWLCVALLTFFVFSRVFKNKNWYRSAASTVLLFIPLAGRFSKMAHTARLCHTFALLLHARTSIVEAVKLVRNLIGFYPFEKALGQVEQQLLTGKPLSDCFKDTKLLENRIVALIKVGEEVNKLDDIFTRLSDQLNERIESEMNLINSLLEPTLIIFIGIFVGFILIAMYLPIFQISSSVF